MANSSTSSSSSSSCIITIIMILSSLLQTTCVKGWMSIRSPSSLSIVTSSTRTARGRAWLSSSLSSSKGTTDTGITNSDSDSDSDSSYINGQLRIVQHHPPHYLVVAKDPGVVCHHSEFTQSRNNQEAPMLQRTREALSTASDNNNNTNTSTQYVNLIHRLDRGCSGCLLMAYADTNTNSNGPNTNTTNNSQDDNPSSSSASSKTGNNPTTRLLVDSLQRPESQKTYIALVRGEGILRGRHFQQEGWFAVETPLKDLHDRRKMRSAKTWFRFLAGQDNQNGTLDRPRASLVLARPETGRWHQIRRHLSSTLAHPIIGDSTHGSSPLNREWRQKYDLPGERTCLHLAQLDLKVGDHDKNTDDDDNDNSLAKTICPTGRMHVTCPLEPDMWNILQTHLPNLWKEAKPLLEEEGLYVEPHPDAYESIRDFRVRVE